LRARPDELVFVAGGYGEPIFAGVRRGDFDLILEGAARQSSSPSSFKRYSNSSSATWSRAGCASRLGLRLDQGSSSA